jgi:raffinose/stachyose/melibiose transport system permease protein
VILPLLKPVVVTSVVVQSVSSSTTSPIRLYFLPGDQNATVQLTLFKLSSQFNTSTTCCS